MTALRPLFRRALQVSTLSPLALSACLDLKGYTAPVCNSASALALSGLKPSVIPDVIELRRIGSFGARAEDDRQAPQTLSTTGTACATAADKPSCQATFVALKPGSGFGTQCLQLCTDMHLATTQGDIVKSWASIEELKSFLGVIDTGQEAMLLALANGYTIGCGDESKSSFRPNGADWDVIATKGFACGPGTSVDRHFLKVSADGTVTNVSSEIIERGADNCAVGRRPNGLVSSGRSGCDEKLGAFFSEIAHLEAASVTAFEQLTAELIDANAPAHLVEAARASAFDEVNHAKVTTRLAKRFGATARAPAIAQRASRDVYALALDNASEGCVRETFGALLAHHQALNAQDAEIREAMKTIAEDETRHAELSWAIDGWVRSQLTNAQRAEVDEARAGSLAALRRSLETELLDPAVCAQAGMPTREVSLSMLSVLEGGLFS